MPTGAVASVSPGPMFRTKRQHITVSDMPFSTGMRNTHHFCIAQVGRTGTSRVSQHIHRHTTSHLDHFLSAPAEELASFSILTDSVTGVATISVAPFSSPDKPFFHARVTPIPLLSSLRIPMNYAIAGSYMTLIHPPLPQGPISEEVPTEKWAAILPGLKGSLSLAKVHGIFGLEEGKKGSWKIADGVGFPDLQPYTVAMRLENFDFEFGEAHYFDTL